MIKYNFNESIIIVLIWYKKCFVLIINFFLPKYGYTHVNELVK